MNIYPAQLEPTRTPPDSAGAAGERLASIFGPTLWPAGEVPARSQLRRPGSREKSRVVGTPIVPPTIIDRETGQVIREPKPLANIGKWRQPDTRPA